MHRNTVIEVLSLSEKKESAFMKVGNLRRKVLAETMPTPSTIHNFCLPMVGSPLFFSSLKTPHSDKILLLQFLPFNIAASNDSQKQTQNPRIVRSIRITGLNFF